jgi:hypothetical protein
MEFALGDGGDVRADAAGFLGFARAPDDAALHRAFAGQFTNACHKISFVKESQTLSANFSVTSSFSGKFCVPLPRAERIFTTHFLWPR